MSILSQAVGGKNYIVNGVELYIKSPHVDEDVEFLLEGKKDLPQKEQIVLMKRLIKKMLKESIPEVTEEELNDSVRLGTLLTFIDIFYEVSGLTDEENISRAEKIKSAIEQRREAIARAQSGTKS